MTAAEVEGWLVEVIRLNDGDERDPAETGARLAFDDLDQAPSVDDLIVDIEDYLGFSDPWFEEPSIADLVRLLDIELADEDVAAIETNRTTWSLHDLASFLARRGELPDLAPAGCLGVRNWRIGAFRAIRAVLMDAGVDRRCIRPTSRIADLAPETRRAWNGRLHLLAPGRLPFLFAEETRVERGVSRLAIAAWAALAIGAVLHWAGVWKWAPLLWLSGGVFLILAGVVDRFWVQAPEHCRYTYGELETIADVCAVIETAQRSRDR